MIRAVIVDDEPLARRGLRTLLGRVGDVEVVGECGNGEEAVRRVRETRPDLLLLDVQMPDLDGFGVIRRLAGDVPAAVVFVTAYDDHAIRAFEVEAVDYLVKPFAWDRVAKTLLRVKRRLKWHRIGVVGATLAPARASAAGDRLLVRGGGDGTNRFVDPADVAWLEARGNYVRLHYPARRPDLVRDTVTNLAARLAHEGFLRVSRSAVVNLARVRHTRRLPPGQWEFTLEGGQRVPSSRRYRQQIEARLGGEEG